MAIATYEMNGYGTFFLERCLESIKSQNYSNIEIVVSDHSKDDSLEKLCENYNNIKYIKNTENYGSSSQNFNNAIKNSTGDIIKILCQDDVLYDEYSINDIVELVNENKDFKWLVTSYYHTKDYKNVFNLHTPKINEFNSPVKNKIGTHSCLTISKTVDILFDDNLIWFMDCEYYYRLKNKYGKPLLLKKPNMIQTLWSGQVTNTLATEKVKNQELNYIKSKNKNV